MNGTSTAFFFPASQGIVPQTVPPGLLQQANALLRLVLNGSFIGGAALGGLLVAAFGSGTAIAIDSVTFFVGAVFIGAMRLPASLRLESTNFLADLAVGWKEFRARTWLWVIVLQFSFVNAVESGAFNVLGPVVAEEELGGARDWGLIVAAQAVGMVAGGLVGCGSSPGGCCSRRRSRSCSCPVCSSRSDSRRAARDRRGGVPGRGRDRDVRRSSGTRRCSSRSRGEMLSRLYSYDMVGSIALVPIGYAVAGPVAEVLGVQTTLWAAAGVAVAATLPVLLVRDVQRLERKPVLEPLTSTL